MHNSSSDLSTSLNPTRENSSSFLEQCLNLFQGNNSTPTYTQHDSVEMSNKTEDNDFFSDNDLDSLLSHSSLNNEEDPLTWSWAILKYWLLASKVCTTIITNCFPPGAFLLYFYLRLSGKEFNDNWDNEALLDKFTPLFFTFFVFSILGPGFIAAFSRSDSIERVVKALRKQYRHAYNQAIYFPSQYFNLTPYPISEDSHLLTAKKAYIGYEECWRSQDDQLFHLHHDSESITINDITFQQNIIGIEITPPQANNPNITPQLRSIINEIQPEETRSLLYLAATEEVPRTLTHENFSNLPSTPLAISCHHETSLFLLKQLNTEVGPPIYCLATESIKQILLTQQWQEVAIETSEGRKLIEIEYGFLAATDTKNNTLTKEEEEEQSDQSVYSVRPSNLTSMSGIKAHIERQELSILACDHYEKDAPDILSIGGYSPAEAVRTLALAKCTTGIELTNNEKKEEEDVEAPISPSDYYSTIMLNENTRLITRPVPFVENEALIFSHFTLQSWLDTANMRWPESLAWLFSSKGLAWLAFEFLPYCLWQITQLFCRLFSTFGVITSGVFASTTIVKLISEQVLQTNNAKNDRTYQWIGLGVLALPSTIAFFSYNIYAMVNNMDKFASWCFAPHSQSRLPKLTTWEWCKLISTILWRTIPYAAVCVLFASEALDSFTNEFNIDARTFVERTITIEGYMILNGVAGALSFLFTRIPPYLASEGIINDEELHKSKPASKKQMRELENANSLVMICSYLSACFGHLELLCTFLKNMDGILHILDYAADKENFSLPIAESFFSLNSFYLALIFVGILIVATGNSLAEKDFAINPALSTIDKLIERELIKNSSNASELLNDDNNITADTTSEGKENSFATTTSMFCCIKKKPGHSSSTTENERSWYEALV